jgi:transposase
MPSRPSPRRELRDAYRFPGFTPQRTVVGIFGDPQARIVTLTRRARKQSAARVVRQSARGTNRKFRRVRELPCGDLRIYLEFDLRGVACRCCGGVKQERLDWLATNPYYTKRFALYVGKQCRSASIKEVAEDLRLASSSRGRPTRGPTSSASMRL